MFWEGMLLGLGLAVVVQILLAWMIARHYSLWCFRVIEACGNEIERIDQYQEVVVKQHMTAVQVKAMIRTEFKELAYLLQRQNQESEKKTYKTMFGDYTP